MDNILYNLGRIDWFLVFLPIFCWFYYKKIILVNWKSIIKIQILKSKAKVDFKSSNNRRIKIKGKIKSDAEPVLSPLSKTPCVFYRFVVEQNSIWKHEDWTPIIDDIQSVKCSLKNDSGEIFFDPEKTDIEISDYRYRETFLSLEEVDMKLIEEFNEKGDENAEKPNPFQGTLLKLYKKEYDKIYFTEPLRIREIILKNGDEINISGKVIGDDKNLEFKTGKNNVVIVSDDNDSKLAKVLFKNIRWKLLFDFLASVYMIFILYRVYK